MLRWSGVCYVIHQTLFVRKSAYLRLGLYRHKEFRNSCDYEFILRLGKEKCKVGHVPEFLINYRYHEFGQSADLRITQNVARGSLIIRKEHGFPGGVRGKLPRFYARGKRQLQKLRYRGTCDLISGTWKLKKHMRAKTTFSSNIGLDKLEAK